MGIVICRTILNHTIGYRLGRHGGRWRFGLHVGLVVEVDEQEEDGHCVVECDVVVDPRIVAVSYEHIVACVAQDENELELKTRQ